MSSKDLFSFLDENEHDDSDEELEEETGGENPNATEAMDVTEETDNIRKRRAEDEDGGTGDASRDEELRDEDSEHSSKRPRTSEPSPEPVVVDEFETEAKREVAASAGLTGAVEAGSRLELRHQVRHQVAVPPGYDYIPIANHVPPAKPSREYKFTLDPFQQVSVHAIQRNESVLVSAHTSAGKTVVAEYAIAQCLENKQRVIYTSPIKV